MRKPLWEIFDANVQQQAFQQQMHQARLIIPRALKEPSLSPGIFEPARMELRLREQSLLFQFTKFGCLSTKAVGGSGAAERDNPFTFRCGMEPVIPRRPSKNQPVEPHASLRARRVLPVSRAAKTAAILLQSFFLSGLCRLHFTDLNKNNSIFDDFDDSVLYLIHSLWVFLII